MKKLLIAAAAIAAFAAPSVAQENDPNLVTINASDTGRTVTLRAGQRLSVSVEACVGCPYGWALTRLPANLSLTGIEQFDRNDRSGPNPIVGGNKTVTFHFRVEGAGRGNLELRNTPFVRGARNGETARYTIVTR